MVGIITVVGGSDSSIAVTVDGSDAYKLAEQFRDDLLSHYYQDKDLDIASVNPNGDLSPNTPTNKLVEGTITEGGSYNINDNIDYLVVGGYNAKRDVPNPILLKNPVTINSSMSAGKYVQILAGVDANRPGQASVEYHAGRENGSFIGGSKNNPIYFAGNERDGGNWRIVTGDGDDTIVSGSGNNTIQAGGGNNKITLGNGSNSVNSTGQDTIESPFNGGFNTITLRGGNSQVNVGNNSVVNDVSEGNTITVGGGSTVIGGTSGNVTFNSAGNGNQNMFVGGDNNTVTATADNFQIIHGSNNKFNVTGDFRFFNGTGETYATINGSNKFDGNTQIFGANGLDFHLSAQDNNSAVMFVAGIGANQTLDGSSSSSRLLIYADTTPGSTASSSRLVGIGGSGDDTLVGGVGSSTLTGGDGSNLFLFTNGSDDGGNTVITDFSKSKGNKVQFLNYGFDQDDINNILKNAKDDENGNAVLDLFNHKLTLQGVSVNDLDPSQFIYYNSPTKMS